MSVQPIYHIADTGSGGTRAFFLGHATGVATGNQADANQLFEMPSAGTFRNLKVIFQTAPGATRSWDVTLQKAGVDTALTCNVADAATAGSDTTHTVHFNQGDTIRWNLVRNNTATSSIIIICCEFVPDADRTAVYGFGTSGDATGATTPAYDAPFYGYSWVNDTGTENETVIQTAGNVTHYRIKMTTAPGAAASGKSRDFALYLNGTKQDGTGGTVNTTCSVFEAATSATASFTLPVAVGDRLRVEMVSTNTPATSNGIGGTIAIVGTTFAGQFAHTVAKPNGTVYAWPVNSIGSAGAPTDATETNRRAQGATTTFQVSGLRLNLTSAPGAGKSHTVTVYQNGSPTAQTVTVSDAATSNVTSGAAITIADGDTWSLEFTSSGSPGIIDASISLLVGDINAPTRVVRLVNPRTALNTSLAGGTLV